MLGEGGRSGQCMRKVRRPKGEGEREKWRRKPSEWGVWGELPPPSPTLPRLGKAE